MGSILVARPTAPCPTATPLFHAHDWIAQFAVPQVLHRNQTSKQGHNQQQSKKLLAHTMLSTQNRWCPAALQQQPLQQQEVQLLHPGLGVAPDHACRPTEQQHTLMPSRRLVSVAATVLQRDMVESRRNVADLGVRHLPLQQPASTFTEPE